MNEEEKKAIEDMNRFASSIDMSCVTARQMQIILNLIERLQKENTEQKAEIERRKHDNKTLKEFVSAVFNEDLNDKYIIHLTDKQNNAVIENAQNDINQKWIQKVKNKIEEEIKYHERNILDIENTTMLKGKTAKEEAEIEFNKYAIVVLKKMLQELLEGRK